MLAISLLVPAQELADYCVVPYSPQIAEFGAPVYSYPDMYAEIVGRKFPGEEIRLFGELREWWWVYGGWIEKRNCIPTWKIYMPSITKR